MSVPARRGLFIVASAVAIWSAVLLGPATAAEPEGATFVDDSPLVDRASPGSEYTIPIVVLNGSREPVRFTLAVISITLPSDETALPVAPTLGPDGVAARSGVISKGLTWATDLTLRVPDHSQGSYAGRLVVYASDGSIARRDFSLAIQGPSASPSPVSCPMNSPTASSPEGSQSASPAEAPCPVPTPGTVLAEPFPATIIVAAERAPGSQGDAPAASFALDPALVSTLIPGALISDDGEIATMTIAPTGEVVLVGQGPGAYKGKLARAPIDEEKAPVGLADLILNVRDGPGFAIVLLVLGLCLAIVVEWMSTDLLPGRRLDARLAELRTDAEDACSNHQRRITRLGSRWPGDNNDAPRIEGDAEALLTKGIVIAQKDFDDSASLDVRTSRWGINGSEFLKLVAFVTTYRAILSLRESVADEYLALITLVPLDDRSALLRSGLRLEIYATLSGFLITDEPTLNTLKTTLENLWTRMGHVMPLAALLTRMRALDPEDADYQGAIDALWVRVANLESGPLAEITQIETEALALRAAKLKVLAVRHEGFLLNLLQEPASADRVLVVSRSRTQELPDVAPLIRTPGELRDALRAWNWLFMAILLPVLIVIVLSTQYFGKATFGTPADYATIFVWGFVGTTGGTLIKLAASSFKFVLPSR